MDGIWMEPTKKFTEYSYRIKKKDVLELKMKSKNKGTLNRTHSQSMDLMNINIWDEPNGPDFILLNEAKTEIKAASLNKLVQEITSEETYGNFIFFFFVCDINFLFLEPDFLNAFLLTYRSFTSPHELLQKLIQR